MWLVPPILASTTLDLGPKLSFFSTSIHFSIPQCSIHRKLRAPLAAMLKVIWATLVIYFSISTYLFRVSTLSQIKQTVADPERKVKMKRIAEMGPGLTARDLFCSERKRRT